ncbi:MAG: FliM/FliN family flagellar motor switch protein [Erythrobacter sp.]|nr:FliM/FliN family flagellar motor switch protein [Erythrobacter sp.]
MNLAQKFYPARALAQHCAELTERGPRPEERAESLASWRRDVAREVAQDMTELLSGAKLEARLSEVEHVRGAAVFQQLSGAAANSLLRCGADDQTALLSFPIATAIALTDRSFGGSGEVDDQSASTLPRSAALLIEQAARSVASAIARVSAGEVAGDVIIRSENAARLKPFTPSAQCALFTLEVNADDGASWSGTLAMTLDGLDSLLPGLGSQFPANDDEVEDSLADFTRPDGAVFGAVPLSLEAVLAEFELSLGQLNRLAPGDEIPIAIAREIPLRMGTQLVANGSLGTKEDRMALKLTSVPFASEEPKLHAQRASDAGGNV